MTKKWKVLAALLLVSAATSGFAMTKAEFKAEKQRIAIEYKSAIQRCKTLVGNQRDVCKQQAKGRVSVAKAQLKARAEPSARQDYKVRMARANAANAVARERCDDLVGEARTVCRQRAKENYARDKNRAAGGR